MDGCGFYDFKISSSSHYIVRTIASEESGTLTVRADLDADGHEVVDVCRISFPGSIAQAVSLRQQSKSLSQPATAIAVQAYRRRLSYDS